MEELIAKRYIKAIEKNSTVESMEMMASVFSVLAESFNNKKFVQIINNPNIDKNHKSEILLKAVKSADSKSVENLIKLLAENNRINIIPAIAEVLRKNVATKTKNYNGVVYSDSNIDERVIKDLSNGLGKKFDSTISLEFVKSNFNGIKVDVQDLGIEIGFSKSRINDQMVKHIIKAI